MGECSHLKCRSSRNTRDRIITGVISGHKGVS